MCTREGNRPTVSYFCSLSPPRTPPLSCLVPSVLPALLFSSLAPCVHSLAPHVLPLPRTHCPPPSPPCSLPSLAHPLCWPSSRCSVLPTSATRTSVGKHNFIFAGAQWCTLLLSRLFACSVLTSPVSGFVSYIDLLGKPSICQRCSAVPKSSSLPPPLPSQPANVYLPSLLLHEFFPVSLSSFLFSALPLLARSHGTRARDSTPTPTLSPHRLRRSFFPYLFCACMHV